MTIQYENSFKKEDFVRKKNCNLVCTFVYYLMKIIYLNILQKIKNDNYQKNVHVS